MFGALDEGPPAISAAKFAARLHSDASSVSDGHRHRRLVAGRGCAAQFEAERSFHILELSNWSLRQDSANLAKHVAHLRREHKRASADLQLADQDTSKYGTKGDCPPWDEAFVTALRRNIDSGIGATVLTDLRSTLVINRLYGWEIGLRHD